ncbi:MAG: alpha/beta fold hydrolase [Verrucomicrobia bacterium]|nr:alpha/beta fold hydrolase [Verrucomicrobiota bacterium]
MLPRALLIHGLGDHAQALPQRHARTALEGAGFEVIDFDLPGHGSLAGASAVTWSECREAVRRQCRRLADRPLFLVGLSLGGLLALQQALDEPAGLAGVVAAAPALDPHGAPALVRWLVPRLARVFPAWRIDPGLDLRFVSREPALAREYLADPQRQTRLPLSLLAGVLPAIAQCHSSAPRLRVPTLLLQGDADRIVPPAGARAFATRAGGSLKVQFYEGALHNLFLETNRAEIFADLTAWLHTRLALT